MKKALLISIFIFFLCPLVLLSENIRLKNYSELYEALLNGERVKVIIHYGKTQLISDNEEFEAPDVIGGMEISAFEYFSKMSIHNPKAMIVTSETVLIGHPRYGHVYNYARIRFYEDNAVQISTKYLTTDNYEAVMDQKFYGKINDGKNQEAVYLYKSEK